MGAEFIGINRVLGRTKGLGLVARSAIVGAGFAAIALIVLAVLLLGALAAFMLAFGSSLPAEAASRTFFFGGVWIDLSIIVLVSFVSGFFLCLRRLHSAGHSQ